MSSGLVPMSELQSKPMNGTAYGYARVSTVEQATGGDSIASQKQRIYEYYLTRLKPQGVLWGGWHVDPGVSAFKVDWQTRPAGRQLLAKLKKHDHVICDRVDRMCRSARNMFNIIQFARDEDMAFHFLDANLDPTSPMGEVIIGVIAIISQLDSSLKSKRMKEIFSYRMRMGNRISHNVQKTTRRSITTTSKTMYGIRMIEKSDRIDYHLHWRIFAASKFVHDNLPVKEYARRSILWMDAKREGRKFVVSTFTSSKTQLMFSAPQMIDFPKTWAKYIAPFLAIAPCLPYPPDPDKQDKDILWASALLDPKGRIRKWKFAFKPEFKDKYKYDFVEPRLVYRSISKEVVEAYGRRTGKTEAEIRYKPEAPSNKSSRPRRVRRRLISTRRAKRILHKKSEQNEPPSGGGSEGISPTSSEKT